MKILDRKKYDTPKPGMDCILIECPCGQQASVAVEPGTEAVSEYLNCSKCGAKLVG